MCMLKCAKFNFYDKHNMPINLVRCYHMYIYSTATPTANSMSNDFCDAL